MDFIDALIKKLQEAKEELTKNVNMSYSKEPNMVKEDAEKADYIRPDAGYGKVTVKDTNPKPIDPKKPGAFGNVILKDEMLSCSANGQWKIMEKDSKDPALAPKDRKVKELQVKIDSGTYKPDAGKIADAMLKPKK